MPEAHVNDHGAAVDTLCGDRSGRSRPDATTEEQIAAQIAEDDAEAMRDAAAYVRRVRRKVGLSQTAFARRIGVPVDTVRNWEQGKRLPRGPARALLRIIDRAPELALAALVEDLRERPGQASKGSLAEPVEAHNDVGDILS